MEVVATSPVFIHASVKRRKNVWYSVKDGNWTDPTVWQSNATKRWSYPGQNVVSPVLPMVGDDVYINHSVAVNISAVLNNLFISGALTSATNGVSLLINGDVQCTGTISFTSNIAVTLRGVAGYVTVFSGGTLSGVTFSRIGDQDIIPNTYRHLLTANNVGTKYIGSGVNALGTVTINANTNLLVNWVLSGALSINSAIFECLGYNLTVNSTTAISGRLSKNGSGALLFIGLFSTSSGLVNFSGNPSVEFRGGLSFIGALSAVNIALGTGIISFTTNNQGITTAGGTVVFTNCLVDGPITVTKGAQTNGVLQIDNYLDGTAPGSTFVNQGIVYFNTTITPMATFGTFDKDTYDNTVGYVVNANLTLPYLTYRNLIIGGTTGVKKLGGNTVVSGNLSIGGSFDLDTHDLTVTGATSIPIGANLFQKLSAGNILFIGSFSILSNLTIDLSGNPAIELRGGMVTASNSTALGASVFTFTTNNQTINSSTGSFNFGSSSILIAGAITLTIVRASTSNIIIAGDINGNNAASIYENKGEINYKSLNQPMVTGILECNTAANVFRYNLAGDQDVKGTTYRTLEFGGSGIKKLLGNVVVNTTAGGSWSITGTATIDYNGFSITTI